MPRYARGESFISTPWGQHLAKGRPHLTGDLNLTQISTLKHCKDVSPGSLPWRSPQDHLLNKPWAQRESLDRCWSSFLQALEPCVDRLKMPPDVHSPWPVSSRPRAASTLPLMNTDSKDAIYSQTGGFRQSLAQSPRFAQRPGCRCLVPLINPCKPSAFPSKPAHPGA